MVMSRRRVSAAVLAFGLSCLAGCATPPRQAAARAPSQRQRAAMDQDFYLAVSAYANGDYATADRYLARILALSPNDKDALALRRRIRAAERVTAAP